MVSMISSGVKVNIETFYQQDYSNPLQQEYMFAYRITIENHNPFPVQLLSRHWWIFDSGDKSMHREVEGEGVIGMQPVISSGDEYQYVSGCNLHAEIGFMRGEYTMQNTRSREKFLVRTPKFEMFAPFKYN